MQITSMKREIKNVNSHKVPICERLRCLFLSCRAIKTKFLQINFAVGCFQKLPQKFTLGHIGLWE